MTINQQMVQHLATLSRLEFSSDAMEAIKADLEKMTAFIEKLNELDTTGVEPLRHMRVWQSVRGELAPAEAAHPDHPAGMLDNSLALREAAKSNAPYFVVPKVLNK